MAWSRIKGVAFFPFLWQTLLTIILWTPGNLYLSNGTKWLYFQFQSKLVHTQVSIITATHVPFNIAWAILAHFVLDFSTPFVQHMGLAFAIWNFVVVVVSVAVQKLYPASAYKIQYLFIFLSFATSFEVLCGGLFNELNFFGTQRFGSLFYLLMVSTLFFQWSTLLTVLCWTFFGGGFVFWSIFVAKNVPEVWNYIIMLCIW